MGLLTKRDVTSQPHQSLPCFVASRTISLDTSISQQHTRPLLPSPSLQQTTITKFAMPTQQTAEFKKAVEDSRKLKEKPGDDELLQVCFITDKIRLPNICHVSDRESFASCMVCSNKARKIRQSRSLKLQACSS